MMTRRMVLLLSALVGLMALTAGGTYRHMATQRESAVTAETDLAECKDLRDRIQRFRQGPAMAAEHEKLDAETSSTIETAAQSAGIPAGNLVSISPEPPVRVGETAYKERPTGVLLNKVTLSQVVALLHGLMRAEPGLNVKSIRLSAGREDDAGDRWTAELTLTYLIYDPPKDQK